MICEVLSNYVSDDPNPIELTTGDTVILGAESDPDGLYPNWVFCVSEQTGKKGWVAKHVLSVNNGVGIATDNYTSKEMSVTAGDRVDTINELNGWYWCIRKTDYKTGWVAKDNLKLIE